MLRLCVGLLAAFILSAQVSDPTRNLAHQIVDARGDSARDTLKPRLDFIGTIGSRGRNPNLPDTLAQAAGLDQLTWSAGLNFQWDVENRTARGTIRSGCPTP